MLFKWLGIAFLFALSNGWGMYMAARYQARAALLEELRAMAADMSSSMGALLLTPGEWMRRYGERSLHPFVGELLEALNRNAAANPSQRFSDTWNKAVSWCVEHSAYASALREADVAALRHLGGGLEAGESGALNRHLSYSVDLIDEQRREAVEECARKKTLHMRIGFLAGLGFVIILA